MRALEEASTTMLIQDKTDQALASLDGHSLNEFSFPILNHSSYCQY